MKRTWPYFKEIPLVLSEQVCFVMPCPHLLVLPRDGRELSGTKLVKVICSLADFGLFPQQQTASSAPPALLTHLCSVFSLLIQYSH